MASGWRALQSLLASPFTRGRSARIAVVALLVNEGDQYILKGVSEQPPFEIHFAQSPEEAWKAAKDLAAPLILFDRDWPGSDWRTCVERLAALPHRACVVLISGVSDGYLLREVTKRGGWDILRKPLHADKTARVVRLALSYWNSGRKSRTPVRA